jgi:hypothetical protein
MPEADPGRQNVGDAGMNRKQIAKLRAKARDPQRREQVLRLLANKEELEAALQNCTDRAQKRTIRRKLPSLRGEQDASLGLVESAALTSVG